MISWTGDGQAPRVAAKSFADCGDAQTADHYHVPRALGVTRGEPFRIDALIGLEAAPYDYAESRIRVASWALAKPAGWELSQRPNLYFSVPAGFFPTEFFVRRFDQPDLLFRYGPELCIQPDGRSVEGRTLASPDPSGVNTLELPPDLPHVVVHQQGDYISADEVLEIVHETPQAGGQPVWMELGNAADIAASRGTRSFPSLPPEDTPVVWSVLVSLNELSGPQRSGHEAARSITIDAVSGRLLGIGCCVDLLFP